MFILQGVTTNAWTMDIFGHIVFSFVENWFSLTLTLFLQRVTRRNDGIDGTLIGANASTEEADEGTEEGTVTDVDIILNHNLQPSMFSKKSYQLYIKDYMKT